MSDKLRESIEAISREDLTEHLRDLANQLRDQQALVAAYSMRRAAEVIEGYLGDSHDLADDSLDLAHQVIMDGFERLMQPKPTTCAEVAVATVNYSAACDVIDRAMGQLASVRTNAARDVLRERVRQVKVLGQTHEHDDEHQGREIAAAAACYALRAAGLAISCGSSTMWPWGPLAWKPDTPRRMLVKAGALIMAEIERLDRAAIAAEQRGAKA